jgi:acyl-CoA reductase-like NAD-dependent aldehyde dehydrogenase
MTVQRVKPGQGSATSGGAGGVEDGVGYMAGAELRAGAASTISCYEPATMIPLGEVGIDSRDDVLAAVARARSAQSDWSQTSFSERRRVLRILLKRVLQHADEICLQIVRDSGKTRENAMMGEIWPVVEKLRWTIAHGEKHLRSERVSSGLFLHKKATIEFHPLGVIGVICPWNYPFQNILGPIIPALFAGNACVVKVSEWVAWSSERFALLLDDALREAGVSPDLLQIVQGHAEAGRAVVQSGVDKIIFTGSVDNGRKVLADTAQNITPVILELGGKDALIVCDDAHLEQAAHAAMAGVFINCGQNCLASERVLVFDGIYDRFEGEVLRMASQLRQGASSETRTVDLSAIVSAIQLEHIDKLVARAVQQGARVLLGGKRGADDGQFYQPTILADVTPEMEIMNEELFGPVMLLCRVRDETQAVEIANGTNFGLSCTVMSKSVERAERMGRQIQSGSLSINDYGLTYMAQDLPFGGVKTSGFGRLNGREGLRGCTNIKAVLTDRWPIHMPAKLYPVGRWDYDVTRGVLRSIYGRGLSAKASAAKDLLTTLGRMAADRKRRS